MHSIKFLCWTILPLAFLWIPLQTNGAVSNACLITSHAQQSADEQTDNAADHRTWFKKKNRSVAQEELKNEPFGTLAVIFAIISVVGLYGLFALFTAPIGILFSIISLVRIKKHPEKWKGKKRSQGALHINLLALGAAIVLLLFLITYVFD